MSLSYIYDFFFFFFLSLNWIRKFEFAKLKVYCKKSILLSLSCQLQSSKKEEKHMIQYMKAKRMHSLSVVDIVTD